MTLEPSSSTKESLRRENVTRNFQNKYGVISTQKWWGTTKPITRRLDFLRNLLCSLVRPNEYAENPSVFRSKCIFWPKTRNP